MNAFTDSRFVTGMRLFNSGDFYQAHEIWEGLWNEVDGNEKEFLRALIQIAAGYLKFESGQLSGAIKLLERGTRLLRTTGQDLEGLQAFIADVESHLETLRQAALSGDPRPSLKLPQMPIAHSRAK